MPGLLSVVVHRLRRRRLLHRRLHRRRLRRCLLRLERLLRPLRRQLPRRLRQRLLYWLLECLLLIGRLALLIVMMLSAGLVLRGRLSGGVRRAVVIRRRGYRAVGNASGRLPPRGRLARARLIDGRLHLLCPVDCRRAAAFGRLAELQLRAGLQLRTLGRRTLAAAG